MNNPGESHIEKIGIKKATALPKSDGRFFITIN